MIKCRECGAPIEELAERCPYCGAINELGAEHKYMQDMYDLKDDLKEVGNIPSEEIKAEVKSNDPFYRKCSRRDCCTGSDPCAAVSVFAVFRGYYLFRVQ